MSTYVLEHLSDHALLRGLEALVARDRATTAALLAHVAEVDARQLYRPEGYSTMHEHCVRALGLSEDTAFKRIRAVEMNRARRGRFRRMAVGGRVQATSRQPRQLSRRSGAPD